MDNQHRKIKTYRELDQNDIDAMNAVKELEDQVGEMIEKLGENYRNDARCLSIARTELQKGFMFAVRAIAQPASKL